MAKINDDNLLNIQNIQKTKEDEEIKEFMETFGGRVKELREKKIGKQCVLGELLEYGDSAISKLESGNLNIPITKLKMLSEYFGVSIAYLCGETDCKNFTPDMGIKEIMDKEQYEKIIDATVFINQVMKNIVPESYKENFISDVYNREDLDSK